MQHLFECLAKLLLDDYAIYHIYSQPGELKASPPNSLHPFRFTLVGREQVEASNDKLIREQSTYHGDDAVAYACLDGARIVGICYFWYGNRYRHYRNFWPLAEREAKLVQIATIPEMRGMGVASALIAHATRGMFQAGYCPLYARIWHSNQPSLTAFQRAGWRRIATVVEISVPRRKAPYRLTFGAASD